MLLTAEKNDTIFMLRAKLGNPSEGGREGENEGVTGGGHHFM